MGDARAADQRLRGYAADIDAGATQEVAFNQRGLVTGTTQPVGERRPGLNTTDDDGIIVSGHGALSSAVIDGLVVFRHVQRFRQYPALILWVEYTVG